MSGSLVPAPKKKGAEGAPAWLLTYGDMVTLLMAFFVMLFAISSVEAHKFEIFLSGLGAFGNPASKNIIEPIGDPTAPAIPAIVPVAPPSVVPPPSVGPPPAPDPGAALDALGARIMAAVDAAGHPGTIEVSREPRGLAITIGTDDILFETGSAVLAQRGLTIIGAVAPELREVGNDVLVEGHADRAPLRRGDYTNWNLSTDRAVAVVNLLADHHGLVPERLSATGFGEFSPRDPGDDPFARARNRRVEIVVLSPSMEGTP
jgi:chemotaxis protein MotB